MIPGSPGGFSVSETLELNASGEMFWRLTGLSNFPAGYTYFHSSCSCSCSSLVFSFENDRVNDRSSDMDFEFLEHVASVILEHVTPVISSS